MRTRVVILVCRISSGFSNNRGFIVDSCNDDCVNRDMNCAEALERLFDRGYKLLSTVAIQSCGQIVYTLAKHYNYSQNGTSISLQEE